jgi:hypothetical protein
MSDIQSDINEFKRTIRAVRDHGKQDVAGKFAIGDALLADIPQEWRQSDGVNAFVKFERIAIILQDRGYEYSAGSLQCFRDTAAAYPRDERERILGKFPHVCWSVLEQLRAHTELWDELIAVIDGADFEELVHVPASVVASVRKRRTVRVCDVREILTQRGRAMQREQEGLRAVAETDAAKFGNVLDRILDSVKHTIQPAPAKSYDLDQFNEMVYGVVPASTEGIVHEFSQVQDHIARVSGSINAQRLAQLPADEAEQIIDVLDMCRRMLDNLLALVMGNDPAHPYER